MSTPLSTSQQETLAAIQHLTLAQCAALGIQVEVMVEQPSPHLDAQADFVGGHVAPASASLSTITSSTPAAATPRKRGRPPGAKNKKPSKAAAKPGPKPGKKGARRVSATTSKPAKSGGLSKPPKKAAKKAPPRPAAAAPAPKAAAKPPKAAKANGKAAANGADTPATLTDLDRRILSLCGALPEGQRAADLVGVLNQDTAIVKTALEKLKKDGRLTQTGKARGTRYMVVRAVAAATPPPAANGAAPPEASSDAQAPAAE